VVDDQRPIGAPRRGEAAGYRSLAIDNGAGVRSAALADLDLMLPDADGAGVWQLRDWMQAPSPDPGWARSGQDPGAGRRRRHT
jgi:hypothetical protein